MGSNKRELSTEDHIQSIDEKSLDKEKSNLKFTEMPRISLECAGVLTNQQVFAQQSCRLCSGSQILWNSFWISRLKECRLRERRTVLDSVRLTPVN